MRFDDFWRIYPRKVGKKPCLQKWKTKKLDSIADKIIDNVKLRLEIDSTWNAGFICNPLTYINQERWEDEDIPTNSERKLPESASGRAARIWRERNGDSQNPVRVHEGGIQGAVSSESGHREGSGVLGEVLVGEYHREES